ncbi:MAG: carbon-nitrogen hydrolase family protein [Ktedonobacteraceae bacterium]|nr:carbon-nitrogen hydrolase family protein [Ktedonobacteraceae bacterium]
MLIAAAQMRSSADWRENLAKAEGAIKEAARHGAWMVVFPEIFLSWIAPGEFQPEIVHSRAQPLDGPFVSGMSELARNAGVWVVAGMLETAEGNEQRSYNTTVVFNERGELLTSYRKTHLFDAFGYRESAVFLAGDALFEPLETPAGRMGLFVCYELRFPEVASYQAERGVDFFVMPAGWVHGPMKEVHWRYLTIARAIENTAYMVACDQVGNQFLGRSLLVDPMGVVLAEGSETEGILYASLDRERVQEVRAKVPSLTHRRSQLYHPAGRKREE